MYNEKFNNVLNGVQQAVPPIWFMRQAGRYHKHYQGMRQKHSFVELCKKPELAAETALGPIRDFDFDISILFSDLLFPLEALGMGLEYNPGPILDRKLNSDNIKDLKPVDEAIEFMNFQSEAVKATRELLPKSKSLIGFVGAPWTLFTYAVEGSHKGGLNQAKSQLELFSAFKEIMEPFLIKNIQLQLDAGAEQVMVMDTAAGELSESLFKALVVPSVQKFAKAFPKKLGFYSKYTHFSYFSDLLNDENLSGLGFDHRVNLKTALTSSRKTFLQGNFDNNLLFCDQPTVKKWLIDLLAPIKDLDAKDKSNWVFGLGHGVLPKTPEDNVKFVVDFTREYLGG